MVERKPSISIQLHLAMSYPDINDMVAELTKIRDSVCTGAMQYTGAGNTGDYLLWTFAGVGKGIKLTDIDDTYIEVECQYQMSYYDDAAKEAAVKRTVDQALAGMKLSGLSAHDKIEKIMQYIEKVYCYKDTSDKDKLCFTAYGALVRKAAVCQGYASLFYRMCNQAGVPCRIVTGTANREQHAWNIVKLNGNWYNLDVVWEISYRKVNQKGRYFLKGSRDFSDHYLDRKYLTPPFSTEYPISANDFAGTPKFSLTVSGGSGSGRYRKGTCVTIKAKAAPEGKQFAGWKISGNITFTSGTKASKPEAKVLLTGNGRATASYIYKPVTTLSGTKKICFGKTYLSIKGNSKASGARVILGGAKEISCKFKLIRSGNYYYIQNVHSGKYLYAKGTRILQANTKTEAARWMFVRSSGNKYRILCGTNAITVNGNSVMLKTDTNCAAQKFLSKAA